MNLSVEQSVRLALVTLLVIGCYLVLRPFIGALLFAMVLAIATWPAFQYLKRRVKQKAGTAALLMVLLLTLCMLAPFALVAAKMTQKVPAFVDMAITAYEEGNLEPPPWVAGLPLVGESIDSGWRSLLTASKEDLAVMVKPLVQPTAKFLSGAGAAIGEGLSSGAQGAATAEGLRCPQCNAVNKGDAKFCDQCGAALARDESCPACGERNDPDARFCDNCGQKLG